MLRSALELDEYGTRLKRFWIRGVDNTLSDGLSRNPVDRDMARSNLVPLGGPVRRIINSMFRCPQALDGEVQELEKALEGLARDEPGKHPASTTKGQAPVEEVHGMDLAGRRVYLHNRWIWVKILRSFANDNDVPTAANLALT